MPSAQDNKMTARWFKSSLSTYNGNCVEVARLPDGNVAIRDSKNRAAAEVLIFSAREWASFVCAVKSKEFDA